MLHFTTFDEVNWPKFLEVAHVYLVLTRPVMRDLDKFKDDRTVGWRRNRARTLLAKIDGLLPPSATGIPVPLTPESKTTFLLEIPREPDTAWKREQVLDPEGGDDRLLACILRFWEEFPDRRICFLSHDMSFRRSAVSYGIDTRKPDEVELTRMELRTPEEERIRDLERELQEYKNSRPKFEFGFGTDEKELTAIVTCLAQDDDTVRATALSQALSADFVHQQFFKQQQHIERLITQGRAVAPEDQFKEYVKACDAYLEKLEVALKRQVMQQHGNACLLSFVLRNAGTAPAEGIKVDLHFPLGTLVMDADDLDEEIEIPDEPRAGWMNPPSGWLRTGGIISPSAFALRSDSSLFLARAISATQPRRRGPLCNPTKDTHVVTYLAPKLQHQDHWVLPPVVAFLLPDEKEGFSLRHSISSDALPRPKEGELSVVWKREPATGGIKNLRTQVLRKIQS